MLTKLYVDNYKCLVNFEYKPDARQLIIGRNGAGKTTVQEVLALLSDFSAFGLPCDGRFLGRTRTRWQDVGAQRFELAVEGNGGSYLYQLKIGEDENSGRPRVQTERLLFNGVLRLEFEGGAFILDEGTGDSALRGHAGSPYRAMLGAIESVHGTSKLAWFKNWLGCLTQARINPWAMSSRSESESRRPLPDMSNFADWYRHLRLDKGTEVFEAINDLKEAIPGLEALDVKEAGLDVRVVMARMKSKGQKAVDIPLHELSEGQRALIALYMLLHCAVEEDTTLLIDEPDNFIALAEIQPWLMKMLARAEEKNAQLIFVSHHPELLNQLAADGGVIFDRENGGPTRVKKFDPQSDSGLTPSEIIARGWENG